MWRERRHQRNAWKARTRETKPRCQRGSVKGKSWKLYDYLAAAAQVQALPPVLSHLELDPRENMPYSNHAGLSEKEIIQSRLEAFPIVFAYRASLALQYYIICE